MTALMREISARLRNLFQPSEFHRRYADGRIQVRTYNDKVMEKAEAFPYGFYAKAKNGRALVFCQGGDTGSFEIFPLLPGNGVKPPELREGDTALYTASGGWIVCRDKGGVEIHAAGTGGKLYFGNDVTNMCNVLIGVIDEIKALVTTGSPASHTIMPASQASLEAYKQQVRNLLQEGS